MTFLNDKQLVSIDNNKALSPSFERLIKSEEGFSTVGMVIALLLTLALIFSSSQVYQVNSSSATVQNVADVAALAAENVVAEFSILATVCDAVVLSLSLTSIVSFGIGIACLCTPATTALSETFIKAGTDLVKTRNNFAEKAAKALNALQKSLPYISAVNASALVAANSGGPMEASYSGIALLLPFDGEEIVVGSTEALSELENEVTDKRETLREAAQEAEEAAHEAREIKELAFRYDCGNAPHYCMYERAGHLAELNPTDNPRYHSVDTWSFSVALSRAQAYYPKRLELEVPLGTTVEAQADSILRKRFYQYACSELAKGYVHEDESGHFKAYFPLLPKNTNEMRQTELYTELSYPITSDDSGVLAMHAWNACPEAMSQSTVGLGSLSQLDSGGFVQCNECCFSVSRFGKIAAATSSIETGFEYHYRFVAEAAQSYQKAQEKYLPYADEVKSLVEGLNKKIEAAFSEALSYRIKINPPGRYGAVALVVNTHETVVSRNFNSLFVDTQAHLGAQAAIAGSTLVKDETEGANVVSSLLDTLKADAIPGVDGLGFLLDIWASLLQAYTDGQDSLVTGVEKVLDAIPFASESGLGTWAANTFSDIISAVGLEPVELKSLKPVLVNSTHVLSADDSNFSTTFLSIKQRYLSLSGEGSGGLFSAALSELEQSILEGTGFLDGEYVIASIEILGEEGPSIPLTITLPPSIKESAYSLIDGVLSQLSSLEAVFTGARRWE